ncbi:MAG: penicillin-binding protein 2 [Sphingobacteriaceae bacterium]
MNSFFERRYVIQGIFITVALILLIRLCYIQLVDDQYKLSADNNVLRKFVIYPARGPIMDRNGKILVQNEPVYDIMVIPKQVVAFDTLEFCKLVGIDMDGFYKRFEKAQNHSRYRASIFEKQLSAKMYASFQEKMFAFPGFYVQPRTVRTYPDSVAAQFLGYIGEVTDKVIEKSNGYYRPGDYIGVSGVEKSYETMLRGQRGIQNLLVDSRNVPQGSFAEGRYDTSAVAGERLISSLDLRIQKLGEQLMQNKVGSIVAIEPSTGEILAFISSPTYDPNLMVGRERGNNIAALYKNVHLPFLIRPIQARYSPGSSFKPLDALIALQEGIITPETIFNCPGGYQAGNHWVGCEHVDGATNLTKGIAKSCNTYFCHIFEKLINLQGAKGTTRSFIDWKDKVNKFGLGVKLDIDLPHENSGYLPTVAHYDKIFGVNRWRSSTIISLAIGQGELLATPLQLANIECTIANRGFYYKPHLIKAIGDKKYIKKEFTVKNYVGVDAKYFDPVINGMEQVVQMPGGTAYATRIPGIIMCGKTGTVQNSSGKNHSVFVAFAPKINPKIAIAVVVENGGYGSTWAAPIASYMVEKYLRDTITKPKAQIEYIINANLLPEIKGAKPKVDQQKADSLRKLKTDSNKIKPANLSASRKPAKEQLLNIAAQTRRKEDE